MTPNEDIRAFLAAIIARPDDDAPRLVFADWLDEHGRHDRAEYIRLEIEIGRVMPGDPRRGALFERRDVIYRTHSAEWFSLFRGKAAGWHTVRGFIGEIGTTAPAFLAHADQWFATQPITRIKFHSVWSGAGNERKCHARELFSSHHLGAIVQLDLESASVNSAGVYWLAANPHLTRLRELVLRNNAINDEGAATLARMETLGGLESLDLTMNRITCRGARELIASPFLKNLIELRLTKNRISNRCWEELEDRFRSALVG